MSFEQAIAFTLPEEGGYVNSPSDPGGETNFGISKRSYPNLDIKNLTREQAIEIYRTDFYNAMRLNLLPSPLDVVVFDMCVHSGAKTGVIKLQAILNVTQDGIIGRLTIGAIHDVQDTIIKYMVDRARYLIFLANFPTNSRGWFSRLFRLQRYIGTL